MRYSGIEQDPGWPDAEHRQFGDHGCNIHPDVWGKCLHTDPRCLYDWVIQVEAIKGGKPREWGIEAGQRPDTELYKKVNLRFICVHPNRSLARRIYR